MIMVKLKGVKTPHRAKVAQDCTNCIKTDNVQLLNVKLCQIW